MQRAIVTAALALAPLLASAVPVSFTSTSVGVTINAPYSHPDIATGSPYELVMRIQFDTDALSVEDYGDGTSWETVWAPASFSFTVGGRSFEVQDSTSNNRLGAMFARDDSTGKSFLHLSISFYDPWGYDNGMVQNGIILDAPGYSLTNLLGQPQQLAFASSFDQSAGVLLRENGALVLGPFWMNASTTTISISAVPEPTGLAMTGAGLALLAAATLAKRRRTSRRPGARSQA